MRAKRNELQLIPLPLKRFTWNAEDSTLSAFESDLRDRKFDGTYPWLQRLFNDATNQGIAIHSHHTDKVEKFYLEKEDCNAEGELRFWQFKPLNKSCKVKQVTIFND